MLTRISQVIGCAGLEGDMRPLLQRDPPVSRLPAHVNQAPPHPPYTPRGPRKGVPPRPRLRPPPVEVLARRAPGPDRRVPR